MLKLHAVDIADVFPLISLALSAFPVLELLSGAIPRLKRYENESNVRPFFRTDLFDAFLIVTVRLANASLTPNSQIDTPSGTKRGEPAASR
jgi:hypothetical protein